jgi:hypothetical protein
MSVSSTADEQAMRKIRLEEKINEAKQDSDDMNEIQDAADYAGREGNRRNEANEEGSNRIEIDPGQQEDDDDEMDRQDEENSFSKFEENFEQNLNDVRKNSLMPGFICIF